MHFITSICGILLLASLSIASQCGPCFVDVVFVVDSSSSIKLPNYQKQFQFLRDLVGLFDIGDDKARFGASIYGWAFEILFNLGDYDDVASIQQALTNVKYMNSSSYAHKAFRLVREFDMFGAAHGGRENAYKFVVWIGDGNPNRDQLTIDHAKLLRDMGVTIITIAVGNTARMDILEGVSDLEDIIRVASFNDLHSIEERVATRICSGRFPDLVCNKGFQINPSNIHECIDINECNNNVCEDACENTEGSYICSCNNEDYAVDPNNKNKCIKIEQCTKSADIVILADASSSIGEDNYQSLREFLQKVFDHFEIGPKAVRIAAMVFSYQTTILFNLADSDDIEASKQALADMNYDNMSTYTHKAFRHVVEYDMFGTANGGRDFAPDIILLATDGNPNRLEETLERAAALRDMGITIFGIPIGDEILQDQLAQITGSRDLILPAASYSELHYIEDSVCMEICSSGAASPPP